MTDKERQRIRERNEVLIRGINDPNVTYSTVSLQQSNFPPRGIIKKDKDALEFIHNPKPGLRLVDSSESSPTN